MPAWLNPIKKLCCLSKEGIYWLYQVQVQPIWIKCWSQWWIWYLFNDVINLLAVPSSNASLAESNGEVSNVWMKRWIFWRCHVQAPARLNQMIELMFFNEVMNLFAESSQQGQPDWLMWWYDESLGWVKPKLPACLNDEVNPLAGLSPEKASLCNWVDWSCWTKPWPCQV